MKALQKRADKIIIIVLILMIAVIMAPIFIGQLYSYPCYDDFSWEGGALDATEEAGSDLLGAWNCTLRYRETTEGTFLCTFLVHYIKPFTRWGLLGFHVILPLITGLFLFALYFLIKTLVKEKKAALFLMLAAVFTIFELPGTVVGQEIFLWYTGCMNYTLELLLAFLAAAFCIKHMETEDKRKSIGYLIGSMLCGFFACGGTLEIGSPNCAWLLAIVIISFDRLKAKKTICLPFLSAFSAALINVSAPGNYKRTTGYLSEGHTTMIDVIRDTCKIFWDETVHFFSDPVFLLLLAGVFLVAVFLQIHVIHGSLSLRRFLLILCGGSVIQWFVIFPVAYGYHTDYLSSARVAAGYEIVARLMILLYVLCLAQFLQEKALPRKVLGIAGCALIAASLLICLFTGGMINRLKDGFSYRLSWDYRHGIMRDVYDLREYTVSTLRLVPKGGNGIVWLPDWAAEKVDQVKGMYNMGLGPDCETFYNQAAAGMFDLQNVTVIYP